MIHCVIVLKKKVCKSNIINLCGGDNIELQQDQNRDLTKVVLYIKF